MTQLHLVKITRTEEKEVFGSNPGDLHDHYLGTDTVSESSKFVLLTDEELEDAITSAAESCGELTRVSVFVYMSFDSEDLPEILQALATKPGGP